MSITIHSFSIEPKSRVEAQISTPGFDFARKNWDNGYSWVVDAA